MITENKITLHCNSVNRLSLSLMQFLISLTVIKSGKAEENSKFNFHLQNFVVPNSTAEKRQMRELFS